MKEYDIEIRNVSLSPLHKYVLAEDFDEAYKKALKILKEYYNKKEYPDVEITKIECECEIMEVK